MTAPAPQAAAPPLRRTLDRYELIAEIARGGMGSVVLARLAGVGGFQRLFAIKLMHPHLAEDEKFVKMLLDEARLAARIHHPNCVPIVDVCHGQFGYYVVMDYIDGFTLAKVASHPALGQRDRHRVGLRILLDALTGLEAAHNLTDDDGRVLGLVHRDVSPQNILVGTDGMGRLTDFGIALAEAKISSTEPGIVKGKMAYMAPEQALAQRVDRRADVWAMGVMLWELLTGIGLFRGETYAATMHKVLHEEILPPSVANSALPPAFDAVCARALARDLDARYPSAREMSADLARVAERAGLLATMQEVSDVVRDLFRDDIAARQAAIREHVAALGRGSMPVNPDESLLLPKLVQQAVPAAVSAGVTNASIPGVEVDSPAAVSAVVPTQLATDGFASTVPRPVSSRPASPARYVAAAVLFLSTAGGAIGAAYVMRDRGAPRPQGGAPAVTQGALAPEQQRAQQPAARQPAARAVEAQPPAQGPQAQQPAAQAQAQQPAGAVAEPQPAAGGAARANAAAGTARDDAAPGTLRRRRARDRARGAGEEDDLPSVEANPYLRR